MPTDFATTRFAVPVRLPLPWQLDCLAAVTVNVVVPSGVAPVVATVSDVLGVLPFVPVRLVLPKVAVAFEGRPLALRSTVHDPSLPAIGTLTLYAALPPGTTVRLPGAIWTDCGFASVNAAVAVPDAAPVATTE
jgi:hypothetical protein